MEATYSTAKAEMPDGRQLPLDPGTPENLQNNQHIADVIGIK